MTMEKGTSIQCLDHGYVQYVDHMGSDQSIVAAARTSYAAESKGEEKDRKLIEYLFRNMHTSPFEFPKVVLVVHMPIFVARQYIRHRMQNVNEVSARYTELPEEFYIPRAEQWRAQDTKNKQSSGGEIDKRVSGLCTAGLEKHCTNAYGLYKQMLADGVAREMARMVLPLNIYTTMRVCWDLKNLLHFIRLRDDAHAQAEIQEYGRAIKTILKVLFPWTMETYERFKFQCVDTQHTMTQHLPS